MVTSNGTKPASNSAAPNRIDTILETVTHRVDAYRSQNEEADRVAALKAAQDLVKALQKPRDAVYHLAYSPTHPLCVRIGIDLEIFTTLSAKNGPVTLAELAAVKSASPILVAKPERVLRILAGIGYVEEPEVHVYAPSEMTHHMADRYNVGTVKFIWDLGMTSLAKIPEFLRENKYQHVEGAINGPFQYAHKIDNIIWEWVATSPELLDTINTFMEGDRGSRPSWLTWFPVEERLVEGFEGGDQEVLFVDVAGGRGHDLKDFCERFPQAKGRVILEDLPHVLDEALPIPGVERVAFDLFQPQPIQGARVYYLKFILHDWSHDQCHQILRQIHQAMRPGYSKLVIEEFILPEKDCPMLSAMWDWEMMVFCNSMERSRAMWEKLLDGAGFQAKFFSPPGDGQGVIEADVKVEQ
ncbi:hypothetical protein FE257_003666 [Aspergillus nanangensis]|uniref:O-methyltransferase C-terminal domain-containing protein n=1 Tax=Aspergillus nanangensis TaxID=2582783 RepID=A0AAD4CS07_ASPNN|nr:hypothetical protein FE257_003666 [Aspergillus nanangensis]